MANPIGRRKRTSPSAEVEALKKELSELKAAYERDMALISTDIQTLNNQIAPATPE
jgi:hypothetical protein